MKKILITGANSYIGTSFEKYITENFSEDYQIDTIDMIDGLWREKSFVGYDVVYHVAGIAHSDNGKISSEKEKLYRAVNTDLTIETAKKAKADGVKQFIFMSSMIVYGNAAKIGKEKIVKRDTLPIPANCYGDSKLRAENGILPLQDENFKVCILRPPMIYGRGGKGNFPRLELLANKFIVFPYIKNKRSMLYIGNLVEFVRLMIENSERGIFFPQNAEYSNTSELIQMIARAKNKRFFLIKGFSWVLKIIGIFTNLADKAFGNFIYEDSLSKYKIDYIRYTLKESVVEIEKV